MPTRQQQRLPAFTTAAASLALIAGLGLAAGDALAQAAAVPPTAAIPVEELDRDADGAYVGETGSALRDPAESVFAAPDAYQGNIVRRSGPEEGLVIREGSLDDGVPAGVRPGEIADYEPDMRGIEPDKLPREESLVGSGTGYVTVEEADADAVAGIPIVPKPEGAEGPVLDDPSLPTAAPR